MHDGGDNRSQEKHDVQRMLTGAGKSYSSYCWMESDGDAHAARYSFKDKRRLQAHLILHKRSFPVQHRQCIFLSMYVVRVAALFSLPISIALNS